MCTNISEDISQIRLTRGEMTFDRPVCAPHPLAAQPRLPAGGEEPLLVEVVGCVLDDGLVGAVVLAEHDLAGEVGRVEAVEALQEALVEVALHRERREDLGAELHVVAGQDDARSAPGFISA